MWFAFCNLELIIGIYFSVNRLLKSVHDNIMHTTYLGVVKIR